VSLALPSLDGGELELASFRGRVLVVHFFTTWSLAAQVDLSELKSVRKNQAPGTLEVVGVGLDPDGPKLLRPWRKAMEVDFPVVLASEELTKGETVFRRIQVVPTTIVVDGAGRIAWRHEGGLEAGQLARVVHNVERGRPPL